MIKFYDKHKEFILYIFLGGFTTLINIIVYYLCTRLFEINTVISTIIAWIIAVLFAYITNRKFVFNSNKRLFNSILKEFLSFISCRFLSGIIDLGIMFVFVDIIGFEDIFIKIFSNILVIFLNYIVSKFVIFR